MIEILLAIMRRRLGIVSPTDGYRQHQIDVNRWAEAGRAAAASASRIAAQCEPAAVCAGPHQWHLIALTARERIYECRVCPTRWKSFAVVHVDADGFEARIWATPPR